MARTLEQLLGSLYGSILDDLPWLAFLEALERHLPCHHGTMVLRRPRDGDAGILVASPSNNPALAALQREHYRDSPFLDLPEGKICVLTESELKRQHTTYYQHYIRHFSLVTELIGVNMIEPRTGMIFRLRAARIDGEPGFGERERKIIESLLPHLRTAIALYARNALQEYRLNVLDETAGQAAIGSGVLDDNGRILIKNMVLDRVLLAQDGFYARDGVLHCSDPKDDRALRMLLSRFGAGVPQPAGDLTMKVRRAGGDRFWSLLAHPSPLRPGVDEKTRSPVIVLLRDASRTPDVTESALIELLGLTRAEAALAVRLVKGQSLIDSAAALGISRFTARTQLYSIFDRTGVHRQAQLVSHILSMMKTVWG
ncbi:helix-turn-helix transcriptional regulator [Denitratisoma oestradiolicum]|uniref:HTH luxR-type domain-containing protein n=1 Tax=Denitratisoma oestradiolicum TaxID=311182 RepID=A0A6S6XQ25_9PROT|nr:helix-turn-helix transcriptional regulator [Denitratisoma oestradiolicum]CAB1368011.1 conserved protein of unknown function [Denitratisoma oestradiolicum]